MMKIGFFFDRLFYQKKKKKKLSDEPDFFCLAANACPTDENLQFRKESLTIFLCITSGAEQGLSADKAIDNFVNLP